MIKIKIRFHLIVLAISIGLLFCSCDILAFQKGIVQVPLVQRNAAQQIFGKSFVDKYRDRIVIIDSAILSSGNPNAPAWYNAITDLIYVRESYVQSFIDRWAYCHELTHAWQFTVLEYPWEDKSETYSIPVPISDKLGVEQEATVVEYYVKFVYASFGSILDVDEVTMHWPSEAPSYRDYMKNTLKLPF